MLAVGAEHKQLVYLYSVAQSPYVLCGRISNLNDNLHALSTALGSTDTHTDIVIRFLAKFYPIFL